MVIVVTPKYKCQPGCRNGSIINCSEDSKFEEGTVFVEKGNCIICPHYKLPDPPKPEKEKPLAQISEITIKGPWVDAPGAQAEGRLHRQI